MRCLVKAIMKRHHLTRVQTAVLLNIPVKWLDEILAGKRKLHKNKLKQLKESTQ